MIKHIVQKMLESRLLAKMLIKPTLKIHSISYKLASIMAIQINEGIHPKHDIMKYEIWFLNHINNESVILDVGCNTGIMALAMSDKASFVYGIEIDAAHVDIAREMNSSRNIEFICADATTYDYSMCSPIDVVTLSNVLEHIEDRVHFLNKLIDRITWSNEDDKRLLIRVPMIDRDWITLYKRELCMEYMLDNTHFIEYTYEKFESEMNQSGITILSHRIRFGEIYAICVAHR